jgi:hypothetical protein
MVHSEAGMFMKVSNTNSDSKCMLMTREIVPMAMGSKYTDKVKTI